MLRDSTHTRVFLYILLFFFGKMRDQQLASSSPLLVAPSFLQAEVHLAVGFLCGFGKEASRQCHFPKRKCTWRWVSFVISVRVSPAEVTLRGENGLGGGFPL